MNACSKKSILEKPVDYKKMICTAGNILRNETLSL